MPTYSYRCTDCNAVTDKIVNIDKRNNFIECKQCGSDAIYFITAPMVQKIILGGGTYQGYVCPVTDEYITSRKRRNDIMKEHGLVESGSRRK